MIHIRRVLVFVAALITAIPLTAVSAAAQQDTVRAGVDTAQAATDSTQLAQEDVPPPAPSLLPLFSEEVPSGPLPPGSRYVFTRAQREAREVIEQQKASGQLVDRGAAARRRQQLIDQQRQRRRGGASGKDPEEDEGKSGERGGDFFGTSTKL